MTARSAVSRAKTSAVEQVIAATAKQRLVIDRGSYGLLAARGISRREVDRALDELEARGRIALYCGTSGHVVARLVGGDR